jgi:hypothetical protein
VRVQGGEIGRDRHIAVGAPQLTVGEQAVFFLRRGSDNTMRPVGLTMGVYRVKAETGTGRLVIDPPLIAGQTASTGTVVRGDIRRKPMAVPEFESLVRLVITAQASGRRPMTSSTRPSASLRAGPPRSLPSIVAVCPVAGARRVSGFGGSTKWKSLPVRYFITNRDVPGVTAQQLQCRRRRRVRLGERADRDAVE